jgi:hypothetical protein
MAQKGRRAQECGEPQARQRLGHARSFLEVAELTADVSDPSLDLKDSALQPSSRATASA